MMDSRAKDIYDRQQQLEGDRAVWDAHWTEIAERVLPRQDEFTKKTVVEGRKNTEKIFDATALLALDKFASAVDSLVTPATQQYHKLDPEDESLMEDREVRLYLDEVNKIIFRLRYRPMANFSSQAHECYISLGAFGTQGMFTDDILGVGLRYKSIALSELYIAENQAGIVDYVHRKFPLTCRQAMQKFKDKCPEKVMKEYERHPFKKFDFIHCVAPADEYKHGAQDYRAWPWRSTYIFPETKEFISESGYRTFPYSVSRHVTAPRETYGRSPASMVLPDIKSLNEMEKTMLRAAHKIVDPPLLLFGDGILSAFNARPNALNYGGVDANGKQLVVPLQTGAHLPIGLEMADQKRGVINSAFYVTLFQILVDNPQMTATEALLRAQEKGQLLAPTMGRQESEFLGTQIVREIDIASAAGLLPPMPKRLRDRGGRIKVVHTSPLSRLRRADDAVAISRTMEMITPFAEHDPSILDTFDGDALTREIADINGVPIKVLRTIEQVMAIREGRKAAEQTTAQADTLDVSARAAKNLAQAQQAAGFTMPATVQ